MRIRIILVAALLLPGPVLTARASTRMQPPAVPQGEMRSGGESPQQPVVAPPASRGQMLYENHCMSCHESLVHIRARQQARSLAQVRAKVQQWANSLQMRWGEDEVEEVVSHLNAEYYRFERR